jgi:hypothetical protein
MLKKKLECSFFLALFAILTKAYVSARQIERRLFIIYTGENVKRFQQKN